MPTIKAVNVSTNYYVGVTTLADIRSNCMDPKMVDTATDAQKNSNPDLRRAAEQRGENQRQFNKARVDRATRYASYIDHVENGGLGGYPPITLWTTEDLPYHDGVLVVTGGTVLTANDGETQLAARYMLASADPSWLDKPFAVTITTSSTKEAAQQTLHDMNHYATPVSEKETAALNVEGPLTRAINVGLRQANITSNEIKARTEKVTNGYRTTNTILLHGAIGAYYGDIALSSTPNSLIKKANRQFGDLGEGAHIVSGFVSEIMRLPHEVIKQIGSDQMLALGAKYHTHRRVFAPLSTDAYVNLDQELKQGNDGSRVSVNARALAIANRLAA